MQGVTGPVASGIREFELIINPARVHDDYATHGHAAHSYHYCGLAVDVDPERWIWDLVYPWKDSTLEFFGPSPWGGLYDRGHKFGDAALQAAHQNHIHVAFNLTPDQVDALTHVPRRAAVKAKKLKPGQPVASPPPARPSSATVEVPQQGNLEDAWNNLVSVVGVNMVNAAAMIDTASGDVGDKVS